MAFRNRAGSPHAATDPESLTTEKSVLIRLLKSKDGGVGMTNLLNGILSNSDLTFSLKILTEMQRCHFIDFVGSSPTMHFRINLCNEYS